jgi:hypothetical protein
LRTPWALTWSDLAVVDHGHGEARDLAGGHQAGDLGVQAL